jgi:hypothetical protein
MSRRHITLFTLVAALSLSACTSTSAGASQPAGGGGTAAPLAVSTDYPSRCQAPATGPGVHAWGDQPGGDAGDLSTTICKSGWTATIRPSTSVTNKIKTEAIAAYGDYAGAAPGNYELDHLISLELGGAPDAIANLWPEKGLHNAKDPVENAAKRAVCAHTMTLADAQHAIATNWIALGHRLGVTGIPAS